MLRFASVNGLKSNIWSRGDNFRDQFVGVGGGAFRLPHGLRRAGLSGAPREKFWSTSRDLTYLHY